MVSISAEVKGLPMICCASSIRPERRSSRLIMDNTSRRSSLLFRAHPDDLLPLLLAAAFLGGLCRSRCLGGCQGNWSWGQLPLQRRRFLRAEKSGLLPVGEGVPHIPLGLSQAGGDLFRGKGDLGAQQQEQHLEGEATGKF